MLIFWIKHKIDENMTGFAIAASPLHVILTNVSETFELNYLEKLAKFFQNTLIGSGSKTPALDFEKIVSVVFCFALPANLNKGADKAYLG